MKLTASAGSDDDVPYLSAQVNLKGSIKFANNLIFAGRIEGELVSPEGTLIVAENAVVYGNVTSKIVIVEGEVHGNINVLERCELRSRSQLIGDLRSPRLIIEEGATFVGRSEVIPGKAMLWC
jgi:cytoskeletal protein CcmA (bactofilin family)